MGPVHTIHYDDGVYDENLTKAHILKSILFREKKFFPYFCLLYFLYLTLQARWELNVNFEYLVYFTYFLHFEYLTL